MEKEEFEKIAQDVFNGLPEMFRVAIDNVRIIVEEEVHESEAYRRGYRPKGILLGLYEGVALTRRGSGYGTYPVVPDTITLFKRNIESMTRSDEELRAAIRDTLIHEIGHYFGLSEREIRNAGY
jgi:predicted Zn-dependent protease with MMP-like domain